MTAKITVERLSDQAIRMTLVADVQISGTLHPLARGARTGEAASPASGAAATAGGGGWEHELLTVEETAEILQIGRDMVYDLIRPSRAASQHQDRQAAPDLPGLDRGVRPAAADRAGMNLYQRPAGSSLRWYWPIPSWPPPAVARVTSRLLTCPSAICHG